jgi:hypothetical protein
VIHFVELTLEREVFLLLKSLCLSPLLGDEDGLDDLLLLLFQVVLCVQQLGKLRLPQLLVQVVYQAFFYNAFS